MSIKTCYPSSVSQSSESNSHFREFNNLGNIKNNKVTYAKTKEITSKNGAHNRPSTITAKKFKCNIPAGSTVNKITLEYVADCEGNISISRPTIDILNVKGDNKKGKFLTKTLTKTSVSWKGSFSVSSINSDNFGVKISFPANTNNGTGHVKIKYLHVIIDYTAPNYRIVAKKIEGQYINENFKVQLDISNVSKTDDNPNVMIQLPENVSYVSKEGDGSITDFGSTLMWKPGLSKKNLNKTIILVLSITSVGVHSFIISESISNHSVNLNITSSEEPNYNDDDVEDDTKRFDDSNNTMETVTVDEAFIYVVEFEEEEIKIAVEEHNELIRLYAPNFQVYENGTWSSPGSYWVDVNELQNNQLELVLKTTTLGIQRVQIDYGNSEDYLRELLISVRPSESNLTTPFCAVLQLDSGEVSRLGHGIPYTVSCDFKVSSDETYVRDWYKNFRIGVMNNINPNINLETTIVESEMVEGEEVSIEPVESEIIDNTDYDSLTIEEIFEYVPDDYWSDPVQNLNTWENLKVEFPYNEKYPVYIIVIGDYFESNVNCSVSFTNFTVIESSFFKELEETAVLPVPIKNTILNEDLSELNLKLFEKPSRFIVFDFPLGDDFSFIEDEFAITGIELSFDFEFSDQVALTAKLCSPDGSVGTRSIVIDSDDDYVSLGGKFDLWHFKISEISELEKWWFEIEVNNIFSSSDDIAELKFNNIQVTAYTNKIKSNLFRVKVEDENVRYYGMFVKKPKIPEGLKTNVKYLSNDSSDTNIASRMNIEPKEIELEFSIRGCDLDETTEMLRQLARLFVNERDELNKPIPKKIEFSHYPDVHFLYIMEDPFDSDPSVTDYDSKVKLVIPDGTAFANEDNISSTSGVNNGIAKVKPVITFIPTGDVVEITETVSNQCFKITCHDWSTSNTVEIDCINQKISILDYVNPDTGLPEVKDITGDGDFNNDWFVINNEFDFKEDNCIIKTVQFTERW